MKSREWVAYHTGMRSHGLTDRLTRPIFGSKSSGRKSPRGFRLDPLCWFAMRRSEWWEEKKYRIPVLGSPTVSRILSEPWNVPHVL